MTLSGPFPFLVLCFPISSPEDLTFWGFRNDYIGQVCFNCSDNDNVTDVKKEKSVYPFDAVDIIPLSLWELTNLIYRNPTGGYYNNHFYRLVKWDRDGWNDLPKGHQSQVLHLAMATFCLLSGWGGPSLLLWVCLPLNPLYTRTTFFLTRKAPNMNILTRSLMGRSKFLSFWSLLGKKDRVQTICDPTATHTAVESMGGIEMLLLPLLGTLKWGKWGRIFGPWESYTQAPHFSPPALMTFLSRMLVLKVNFKVLSWELFLFYSRARQHLVNGSVILTNNDTCLIFFFYTTIWKLKLFLKNDTKKEIITMFSFSLVSFLFPCNAW